MNVFSYSRLKQYSDCPQSFFYKYVLEMEEPISEALALGKAVHAALERSLKVKQQDEPVDMSECVAAAVAEAPLPISFDEALRLCLNPAIRERTFAMVRPRSRPASISRSMRQANIPCKAPSTTRRPALRTALPTFSTGKRTASSTAPIPCSYGSMRARWRNSTAQSGCWPSSCSSVTNRTPARKKW